MAGLNKDTQDKLPKIKENIEKAYLYFKKNNDRFHRTYKFVFKSNLTESDESQLNAMGKPVIQSNILNAYVSRLCGEYSKQQPSISVKPASGAQVDEQQLMVIEGHFRHIMAESNKTNTQYNLYKDELAGGFSSAKVMPEYVSETGPNAFDQVLKVKRVYEPTMTFFDPMAREMDKSDANFSVELYPKRKEDFQQEYPDADISKLSYSNSGDGFNWTYTSDKEDIIVLADYYEKKKTERDLVYLANKQVMTPKEYDEFLAKWKENLILEQPPVIVKKRKAQVTNICRYLLIKDQIIEEEETEYIDLPHVFFDGDSVMLTKGEGADGGFEQFTKPYVFHGMGTQRLKNLALQALGNDIETMVMHKFMIPKESLPTEPEYLEAYKNPQIAQTMIYNAFMDNDPNKPVPPPREVNRVPLPPEVAGALSLTDQLLQTILGSYDAALGINDNQLSGVAIVEAATQSNAAAMPYLVGNLNGWTRIANIIVNLMPKYYKMPTTIPIIDKEGKRQYVKINQPGGVTFNYDDNSLQVEVTADVNFQIAKNRALMQIIALMQASPLFAQFMNEEGLEVLLDNVEFRGSDILKDKAKAWAEKMTAKMEAMQKAQMNQPNPAQLQAQAKMAEIQQRAQATQIDAKLNAQKVVIEEQKVNNDRIDLMIKEGKSQADITIALAKAQAEEDRARADLQIKHMDMNHQHRMDIHDRLHPPKGKD